MGKTSKTPEETKIGLECCEKFLNGAPEEECCHVCNYANNCAELKLDAIALIRQLEADKKILEIQKEEAFKLAERLEQERDAAVRDCACFPCYTCRERANGDNCGLCKCESGTSKRSHHKWRGPCEENGGKSNA